MTDVTNSVTLKSDISNEIKEMLSDEYNVKTADMDEKCQVKQNKDMNERFNSKFTKQDQVWKTEDKHALEDTNKYFDSLLDESISIRKKLKKTHKIQENGTKKVRFSSSQKRKFDDNVDNVEQIVPHYHQTVLQKNNEIDKSDKENVTTFKTAKKNLKKKDKKQKHEKIEKIIKMLNKITDKNEALIKQENYSRSDIEKNMKRIRELINQFLKIYHECNVEKRFTKYENFNTQKLQLEKQVSELESEMLNIKLHNMKNMHDIVDSHSKINQLQIAIKNCETKFDNVRSQINKQNEYKIGVETFMKKTEKLQKKVAPSKKRYVESQKATVMAVNQSTIDTEKLYEIKDIIFHVASKMTVCIKKATTLIFNIFTFKDEEQSFKETKPSNFMCLLQQFLQKAFAYTTEDLNNNDNTSKNDVEDNVEELSNMTETPNIVYEQLSSLINELSNHEDTNENFNEESSKIPSQASKEKLNTIDNKKYECEITEQLEDTNMDNKLIDVEQDDAKIKETHDMIETKKHNEVSKESAVHAIYSTSLYSHVLKDYDIIKANMARDKKMIYVKRNDFEFEDKENFDFNCKSSCKSSKSSNSFFKSLKFNNLPDRNVNAAQHLCIASENNICTSCNLAKTILTKIKN